MGQSLNIDEIKSLYPNEWVLLGNPVLDEYRTGVLSGIPIYHSRDKREVCYLGREQTGPFNTIKLVYTGEIKHHRVITGIFNRV